MVKGVLCYLVSNENELSYYVWNSDSQSVKIIAFVHFNDELKQEDKLSEYLNKDKYTTKDSIYLSNCLWCRSLKKRCNSCYLTCKWCQKDNTVCEYC